MKIISEFRDYYDSLQGFGGYDDDIKYIRKAEVHEYDKRPSYGRDYGITHICFCGKVYTLYTFMGDIIPNKNRRKNINCYSIEDIDKYAETQDKTFRNFYFRGIRPKHYFGAHSRYSTGRKSYLEDFTDEEVRKRHEKWKHIHERYNAPIVILCPDKRIVNGQLSEFDFARIKDPYSAYQELTQFVGNMAKPEKPIPHIDDKTMAEIKGFDKFSFRKDKSK